MEFIELILVHRRKLVEGFHDLSPLADSACRFGCLQHLWCFERLVLPSRGIHERVSLTNAASLPGWFDVLINVEEVMRINSGFDLCKLHIVVAIRGFYRFFAFVHHHIDVAAAS